MMTSNDYYVWGLRGLRIEMRRQDKSVIDCYLDLFVFVFLTAILFQLTTDPTALGD
jgi:hypothetical protein